MFSGTLVALVTPFLDDINKSVDYESLEKLIEFQLAANIDGLVICASTGEGTLLTNEERIDIINFVTKNINERIPILVGCSSCSTNEAIRNIKIAQDLGASGVLVTSPYYVKPNQEGIFKHFENVSNNTNIPIVVYNIPSRVSVNIELDTLRKIFQLKNIVALKDATKNFETLSILHNEMLNISILSGDDGTLPACLAHGACGAISAAANVYPKEISNIINSWNNDEIQRFKGLVNIISYISKVISITTNPIPIKYILSKMGLIKNVVREPLYSIDGEQLDDLLNKINILNKC
ncbi:MAG: 4-hydroxy-tetrahydrodipicolinate synthase [Alphaproteobacteria bacterium]|nr:4-hydroxy-tetrahydrodipicolinate synthase [Alphaproteobacteria bacterium]